MTSRSLDRNDAPVDATVDERAPLLQRPDGLTSSDASPRHGDSSSSSQIKRDGTGESAIEENPAATTTGRTPGVYSTLSVMLIGVFVSQTDTSLVLATYPKIASEFGSLENGPWLITAFILAECMAQPLYGKLSEIYGRKTCLQASYALFMLGTLGSGIGSSMGEVIASRAVQGLGGAGMLSMVSIIITDIVPIHEVGPLRSYVNILQTTGRGFGGVIGGLLTETIGWRAAFLVQVPPTVIGIALVQWRLKLQPTPGQRDDESAWTKLKRIDFIGAFFLCLTIGTLCFVLDAAGSDTYTWSSPSIIACMVVGGLSAIAFIASGHYAAEPIFPLGLWIKKAIVTNYLIVLLVVLQQISLMASVPLYMQSTSKVSQAQIGLYLLPAFFGNLSGGLLAGYWTKLTRTHKPVTLFGPLMGILAMVLCLTIWTGKGRVSFWESLIILPGGVGNGCVASSAFIAMTAGIASSEIPIAAGGMFLFFNIGAIAGVSVGSAIYQSALVSALRTTFADYPGGKSIIRHAIRDVSYVQRSSPEVRELLVPAFVGAFHSVNCKYF